MYVVESPKNLIRKLFSIPIKKEKYLKASKHDKNIVFDKKKKKKKKMQFFIQISECSTWTHFHHLDLDSGGQKYSQSKGK